MYYLDIIAPTDRDKEDLLTEFLESEIEGIENYIKHEVSLTQEACSKFYFCGYNAKYSVWNMYNKAIAYHVGFGDFMFEHKAITPISDEEYDYSDEFNKEYPYDNSWNIFVAQKLAEIDPELKKQYVKDFIDDFSSFREEQLRSVLRIFDEATDNQIKNLTDNLK